MTNFLIGCIVGMVVATVVISIARRFYEKDKIDHYKY